MAALDVNMDTTAFIMETQTVPVQRRRSYLGMSGIGGKCLRKLWYGFHWTTPQEELKIRTKRIFDRGDIEEARIISELSNCDFYVYRLDKKFGKVALTGEIGEEQEELIGFAGHAIGHPDGRVDGLPELDDDVPALLEMKTAKASKFREYVKSKDTKEGGVYHANRVYYGQAQRYMAKMELEWCLFIVTNKDTEERYYELIPHDEAYSKELERREQIIIMSDEPLEKLSNNKNWLDCKWCSSRDICHNSAEIEVNCRTCDHSDITDNGGWECGLQNTTLDIIAQEAGCKHWTKGWGL